MNKVTKLMTMVNFVLHDSRFRQEDDVIALFRITNYANFLSLPLELWMFVPCGEDGEPLKEPVFTGDHDLLEYQHQKYIEAKQRCYFRGFELLETGQAVRRYSGGRAFIFDPKTYKDKTIEYLTDSYRSQYGFHLTKTALNEIY